MTTITIYETLQNIKIFSSLAHDELLALENISQIQKYDEGENIFTSGDTSKVLMLLIEGVASVFKHDDKGNEIVIGYFKKHEFVAEAATLRHTSLPSSARFETEGSLVKINLEAFEKLFIKHPNISQVIIQSLLDKIELLQQNIHLNIASTATEKILQFYTQNPTLTLDLKQYEIATLLGMTAETFSRNLRKLVKDEKLMKVNTGYKIVK